MPTTREGNFSTQSLTKSKSTQSLHLSCTGVFSVQYGPQLGPTHGGKVNACCLLSLLCCVVLCCVLSMLLTQLSLFVCFNHNDGNDNDGNNNHGNNDDGNNNDTATTMMVTTMMATTTMGTTANGMTAMTTTTTTKRQQRQMERRRMQQRLHGDDNNVDDCGNNSRQQRCTNPCHHKNQTTKRDKLIFSISFLAPAHMRHLLWGDHEHTTMYSMARQTISLDRSARAVVNEDLVVFSMGTIFPAFSGSNQSFRTQEDRSCGKNDK